MNYKELLDCLVASEKLRSDLSYNLKLKNTRIDELLAKIEILKKHNTCNHLEMENV